MAGAERTPEGYEDELTHLAEQPYDIHTGWRVAVGYLALGSASDFGITAPRVRPLNPPAREGARDHQRRARDAQGDARQQHKG
jgi:hypothetical protein